MNISDVSDKFLARCGSTKIPLYQVWSRGSSIGIRVGSDPKRARLTGDHVFFGHNLTHQLGTGLGAFGHQISMDTPIPIGLIRVFEIEPDPISKLLAAGRGGRLGP